METQNKIHIIGIGDDGFEGLTTSAQQLIRQADLLVGAPHVMTLVPECTAERMVVGGDLDAAVHHLSELVDKRVVVLMIGDPLFYGTTRFLYEQLGKERFEVVPHVSSMQLAFARVKESWAEAYFADLSEVTLERVVENVRVAEEVGLFPSEACPPARIARELLDRRIDYFTVYVCENLGSPDERVTNAELADVATHDYSPLSVMVLVRKPNRPETPSGQSNQRLFGNPDEWFLQSRPKRGLLTPAEVRCIALAEMSLTPGSIVWDVGAGSGSVAVEAARLAPQGTVYAIEMDIEDHQLISANAERFGVTNLVPVLGKAPEVWADLPMPDAIFVGGTGRQVAQIVRQAMERLRPGGYLVANVGSIDNAAAVRQMLAANAADDKLWMINIARGVYQLDRVRLESINPTFLLGAKKKG